MLLLAQGRVVSVDRLIDAVWGDDVPGSATASLQAYVSNLRRALRDGTGSAQMASPIVRQAPGYYLDVAPDDVDYAAFAAALRQGGRGGRSRQTGPTRWPRPTRRWRCGAGRSSRTCGTRSGPNGRPRAPRRCDGNAWTAGSLRCWPSVGFLRRSPTRAACVTPTRCPTAAAGCTCWRCTGRVGRRRRSRPTPRHARVLDDELGLVPGAELRELQTAILRQAPELAAWPRPPEWTGAVEVTTPTASTTPAGTGRRVLPAVGAGRPRP